MAFKFITTLVLYLFMGTALAELVVIQPERLSGGFTGYDGKVIQVQVEFKKPLPNSGILSVYIKDKKIFQLTNLSPSLLERFVTRFRLKIDEELNFNVKYPSYEYSYKFKPTVSSDFSLPSTDSYSPSIKSLKVESPQMKDLFGSSPGDCLFLVSNVSMTGDRMIKSGAYVLPNGTITFEASDRVSATPLFGFGISPPSPKCELTLVD